MLYPEHSTVKDNKRFEKIWGQLAGFAQKNNFFHLAFSCVSITFLASPSLSLHDYNFIPVTSLARVSLPRECLSLFSRVRLSSHMSVVPSRVFNFSGMSTSFNRACITFCIPTL